MKNPALDEFAQTDYLRDGHPELLDQVRPAFDQLIASLRVLPEQSGREERLAPFAEALAAINEWGDEIETEERETILGAIYDLGEIVGLDRDSEFAEAWRGDW